MAENEVADSTDWLSTPLAGLTAVESSLRCQVCKDFYDTPMLTSCSHTFCSLCIRRALSNDSKCPLCRATEQAIKLRSNWSMEEAVEAFKAARPAILEAARNTADSGSRSPKRKAEEINGEDEGGAGSGKRLRSSARLSQRNPQSTPSYVPEEPEEYVIQASDDDDFTPEPDDGLVPCPSCQKRMKEWQVFTHLESCPGPSPKKKPAERTATLGLSLQPRQHNTNLERLPALNYSMLKDNALRKRMAELGISSQGSRSLLERRHKEYITIWNANCDAARPKSHHELLRQLDAWERSQGGRAPIVGRAVQNAAVIKDKDFDGSAWATQHNDSFKDLIASARKTSQAARSKAIDDDPDTTRQQAEAPTTPGRDATAELADSTLPSHPEGVPTSGPPGEPLGLDVGVSRPPDQPAEEPEIRDGLPDFYPPPTATYCDPAL